MGEMNPTNPESLRLEILRLTREYSRLVHGANRPADEKTHPFLPGVTPVPYAARVFGEAEVEAAVDSSLDFWLTLGKQGELFEQALARTLGVKYSVLVNSGSSANLVALAAIMSPKLPREQRVRVGDEIITVAAGFPTTVAPAVQAGVIPVFVDSDPRTGNVDPEQLEVAFKPGKTKAVIIAHTLGNPFDVVGVLRFCRKHGLWLIEDNCDALGSIYRMPETMAAELGLDHLLKLSRENEGSERLPRIVNGQLLAYTGSFGDLSTQSFYPPHHITTGEGGAVNIVSRPALKSYVESIRDWGRDCWCASGNDDTCGKRFGWQLGELPHGYDHKYVYSHFGYNLKPLDLQAAIGRVQLERLTHFTAARRRNWETLRAGLADLEDFLEFSRPTHATTWHPLGFRDLAPAQLSSFTWDGTACRSEPSWFGFMLLVRAEAPFTRTDLARHLETSRIGNRMLFGGNLTRQPAFVQLARERADAFRKVGALAGADALMNRALFVGTYPGLTPPMLAHVIERIHHFVRQTVS
jgi:CDP-6-deoxy-D-xylo-4-hexulose-3-dehydrase